MTGPIRVVLVACCAHMVTADVLGIGAGSRVLACCVHEEHGFAPPRLVDDLRADIESLAAEGHFSTAGSGGRDGSVDSMRSALYCDPIARDRSVGNWDAFFATWERLDLVRQELETAIGLPLLPEMEVHYVHYERGGFYQRHVDDHEVDGAASRRVVSFILYLTPTDAPWTSSDGGALRSYDGEQTPSDILPESGCLVLFDSCKVEHEVLPTNRARTCLIGWFHTPCT